MTSDAAFWWSRRRFGCISLAMSFAEVAIILGVGVLIHKPGMHDMRVISKVTSITFLAGMFGSLGFAVAGLVADSHRLTAFIATIMVAVTFFTCGLLLLV